MFGKGCSSHASRIEELYIIRGVLNFKLSAVRRAGFQVLFNNLHGSNEIFALVSNVAQFSVAGKLQSLQDTVTYCEGILHQAVHIAS